MLLENERSKLAEYEGEYKQLLAEWKGALPTRKAVKSHNSIFKLIRQKIKALEAKFSEELATQERFYSPDPSSNMATTSSSSSSSSSAAMGQPPQPARAYFVGGQEHF